MMLKFAHPAPFDLTTAATRPDYTPKRRRAPSMAALQAAFPQSDPAALESFRAAIKAGLSWQATSKRADMAIEGHGCEVIRCPDRGLLAVYVNTGDTYSATLLYNLDSATWRITTWGDYVEAFERRHGRAASESLTCW